MFAHISIGVSDIKKSSLFYDSVLENLAHSRLFGSEKEGFIAYGKEECFFIICYPLDERKEIVSSNGTHLCFKAPSKKSVDNFYQQAIDLGAKDSGKPGIRKEYAKDYYASFIYDPDGHKIEVLARV